MASRPRARRYGTVRGLVRPPALQFFPALCLAALLGLGTAARTRADEPSRVDQLVAGYVLNFTKFVEWPESSRKEELSICIAGNPGIYSALRDSPAMSSGARHLTV